MWIRGGFLYFSVSLLIAASVCHGGEYETVEVVGIGECADCAQNKIKTSQAFSGLRVTIDCKAKNGDIKTRGVGELKEDGSFKVTLPQEILEDGKLKEECYAQLHSASAIPCPAHNALESSKIIFKSKTNGKHTFGLSGNLKFSPATCISAYLWPHHHKYPPLPKVPHYYKYPPIHKHYGHHYYPLPPIYKKPLPPPLPPVYTHPPIPIYKPLPPFYKKPCPPLPKLPPKDFHHPKFGKWPPLPPHHP